MRGHIFWVAIGVIALFVLVDRPIDELKLMTGAVSATPAEETRQPVAGLAVVIDFAARREGRRVAVLTQDWFYCYPESGDVFMVPRGYETDFASVPGAARKLINPFGDHAEAAVIHDWLYAVGEPGQRPFADNIFRYAMKEQGVNIVRRNVMYRTVRVGGDEAYGREDEWRFRDPVLLSDIEPPFEKPIKAAIEVIDCSELDSRIFDLMEKHGTR